MTRTGVLASCFALVAASAFTQQEDVHFVLLGKTANHRQSADGTLTFLNTVFFGEVFLRPGGTATNAYVTGPGDATNGMYFGEGDVLFFAGERHDSVAALDAHFPEGTYAFYFDTPRGSVRGLEVAMSKKGSANRHPGPIRLTVHQRGEVADPGAIDPDEDLRIVWSEFTQGASDPNGIIDDMIYAKVGNCFGELIVHSGHAFEDHALSYVRDSFVVPSESLRAGETFQLEVEFSEMDTQVHDVGLPSIVTHAASTFLDVRTTGTSDRECPEPPNAMDGGQTDRSRR